MEMQNESNFNNNNINYSSTGAVPLISNNSFELNNAISLSDDSGFTSSSHNRENEVSRVRSESSDIYVLLYACYLYFVVCYINTTHLIISIMHQQQTCDDSQHHITLFTHISLLFHHTLFSFHSFFAHFKTSVADCFVLITQFNSFPYFLACRL